MSQEKAVVPQKRTHEQSEIVARSPEQIHASNWVEVSDGLMHARIAQLTKLGAPGADAPEFMGAHKAFIEFAREKLDARDPNFIDIFKDLEIKALDHGPMHDVNYDIAHIKQLDFFATMVDEAQHRHANDLDDLDPYSHHVDYQS
jgi:hypothetical protein